MESRFPILSSCMISIQADLALSTLQENACVTANPEKAAIVVPAAYALRNSNWPIYGGGNFWNNSKRRGKPCVDEVIHAVEKLKHEVAEVYSYQKELK